MSVSIYPMSVYSLFGLSVDANPNEILEKCRSHCERWTLKSVTESLQKKMSAAEASVNAQKVYSEGEMYLKSAATVLLDPSARQCYDSWLSVMKHGSCAQKKLCRARLLWFNDTSKSVIFSKRMIDAIQIEDNEPPKKKKKRMVCAKPQCRECLAPFDFSEQYLVLHCHCTTRVGHVECLEGFSTRVKHKCPVCRQKLLKRRQVSKYLFWNVKEKYKFIA